MRSILTGLAAGLAIAYLTAPRSGKATRDQLSKAANKQTKGLKRQLDNIINQLGQLVDDVKSQTTKQAKEHYNEHIDETAEVANANINKAEAAL